MCVSEYVRVIYDYWFSELAIGSMKKRKMK